MYLTLFSHDQLDTPAVREFLDVTQQIDQANPNPAQLGHLRRLLAENPDLWQVAADLAHDAALHLIDQVILSWLQLNITQCYYTDITSQDIQALSALNYWEKRLSAAQNHYLRACQALVQTRKLLHDRRPTVPASWYL